MALFCLVNNWPDKKRCLPSVVHSFQYSFEIWSATLELNQVLQAYKTRTLTDELVADLLPLERIFMVYTEVTQLLY